MGCGFPLTGGSIRRLSNLVDGVLPHHFLCEVKRSLFFFFSFLPLCVYFAFSLTIKACFTASCFTGTFISPRGSSAKASDNLQIKLQLYTNVHLDLLE